MRARDKRAVVSTDRVKRMIAVAKVYVDKWWNGCGSRSCNVAGD